MHFSNAVDIDRSPHDVFSFVTDLENVPRWNHAIVETTKTSLGPVGVGTTYRQVRLQPSRSEETLRVTAFEPDRLLMIHGDLGPFVGTLTYEFEDVAGGTRLTNTAELEGRGAMRIAAPALAGRVREAVAENLAVLKRLLEAAG